MAINEEEEILVFTTLERGELGDQMIEPSIRS